MAHTPWILGTLLLATICILVVTIRAFHSFELECKKSKIDLEQPQPPPPLIEHEHGWRTKAVIGTRQISELAGYNIGFTFPGNPWNGDRAELCEFIESKGGKIIACGGHIGSPISVVFEDVKDREAANKKLKEFLPELDCVFRSLN